MGNSQPQQCPLCQNRTTNPKRCEKCNQQVCQTCWDYPILDKSADPQDFHKFKFFSGCVKCFKENVALDLSTHQEILGEQNKKEIIFIHGAGSCRKMFIAHARTLSEKHGFRCILMDLPGHGSRMHQPLNLETSIKAIKEAIALCRTKDYIIAGGSLGGYILMQAFGAQPNLCTKAIVMMCGQNVGQGRSLKASLGVWMIGKSLKLMSQASVANNSYMRAVTDNKHLDKNYVKELLEAGIFFKHGEENVVLLKSGRIRQSLQKVKDQVQVLFINGEKDYRDSEKIWLEAVGTKSKLLTYEKGDHFFSHDVRFYDRLIEDIAKFARP